MRFKCLVLDHDDTVVNSSASIHFPSFVEYLKIYRPNMADKYTFEEYILKNFHPGILQLFTDEIGLSEKELAEALYRVSISMGADEKKARDTARRAGEIRKILQRSSDRELDKIMSAIGKERADGIISKVKEKEKTDK